MGTPLNFDAASGSERLGWGLREHDLELLHIALRVTFLIVPAPCLAVTVMIACGFQLLITLATGDLEYYSGHKWCVCSAAIACGFVLRKLRKRPFFEWGGVIGKVLLWGAVGELLT